MLVGVIASFQVARLNRVRVRLASGTTNWLVLLAVTVSVPRKRIYVVDTITLDKERSGIC